MGGISDYATSPGLSLGAGNRWNSTPLPPHRRLLKKKYFFLLLLSVDCTYPINKMIKLTKKKSHWTSWWSHFSSIFQERFGVYYRAWSGCRLTFHLLLLLVLLLPWPEKKINESPDHILPGFWIWPTFQGHWCQSAKKITKLAYFVAIWPRMF
jgi:hypothetical protein